MLLFTSTCLVCASKWHCMPSLLHQPLTITDYGDTSTPGVPAISDLYQLLKSQLDARLAGGRAPMQVSPRCPKRCLGHGWAANLSARALPKCVASHASIFGRAC